MRLLLHDQDIVNFFELLGYSENALTYALGWTALNNERLVQAITDKIGVNNGYEFNKEKIEIILQKFGEKDRGFTDIEISDNENIFLIIEAKIGLHLPTEKQLKKYSSRLRASKVKNKKIVVISEFRREYAQGVLGKIKSEFPIVYMSWHEVKTLVSENCSSLNNSQKAINHNFIEYYEMVAHSHNLSSNKVFCVVLNKENFDVVSRKGIYNYPLRSGWPQDPPNYIAFRYQGKLHSIYHVEKYEIDDRPEEPIFKLFLGKKFGPETDVKNGKIYGNAHLWFDLDTVFICKTIKEAADLTKERKNRK